MKKYIKFGLATFLTITSSFSEAKEAENHKAYVYTELQISAPFNSVPWRDMNPNLKKTPGLINKTWLSGTNNSAGGFYVFDTIKNAQNFVTNIFPKEAESFGVAQTTRIFDAVQTQNASIDMASVYYGNSISKEVGAFVYTELQINKVPFDKEVPWKKRNPQIKKIAGLLNKTWLSGANTGTIGGFYAFDTLENAQNFAIKEFPNTAKSLNAAFYTRIFNANKTAEASKDMSSPFYK